MSYVNLKDLSEFNKYTTGLGAGAFVYVDKFGEGHACLRTGVIALAAAVVFLGVIVMSMKGRIRGDDIDYAIETDPTKRRLFTIVSRILFVQLIILLLTVGLAGYLSIAKIWGWH
jgi:hypothetical protein